jgi:hypothetical protein
VHAKLAVQGDLSLVGLANLPGLVKQGMQCNLSLPIHVDMCAAIDDDADEGTALMLHGMASQGNHKHTKTCSWLVQKVGIVSDVHALHSVWPRAPVLAHLTTQLTGTPPLTLSATPATPRPPDACQSAVAKPVGSAQGGSEPRQPVQQRLGQQDSMGRWEQ